METQADLITGRLGGVRSDGRTETALSPAGHGTSYRASRLGLSPEIPDPSGGPRTGLRGARRLRAARRSARLGWTAAGLLVIGCGLGSYFLAGRIIESFGLKLEKMATHVRRQVATICRLEQQRGQLEGSLVTARADLGAERTRNATATAQLEALVTRLVDTIKDRDEARATLSAEQAKTAKITAQLEASVARLVDAMGERDDVRASLVTEQAKAVKIAAQLEASVARLVDAMKERDRARGQVHEAVREASRAEAKLDLLDRRLRDLLGEQERLKKAVGASVGPTSQPATKTLVLDMMLSQFRADLARFKKALQAKTPPKDKLEPGADTQ